MIDLGTCELKYLNTSKNISEKKKVNVYIEELFESEHSRTSAKQLCTIIDDKHKMII